jgi:mannose-1-phosphate guanylyltransferase
MKDNQPDLVAVIMAGGVGTRFWPLSTEDRPKQFLKLFDDRSFLQKSFDRIAGLMPSERILVLTNRAFVDLAREQLPEIPTENIIGEPFRRDTAAAVCLGSVLCRERFGNPVIVTLTADHMIEPVEVFQKTLLSAAQQAREGASLYTFGVLPTYPATSYGYLELGSKLVDDDGIAHFQLTRFKEKPDQDTALRYIESGRFYWNSGMFLWTVEAIIRELEKHLPDHLKAISDAARFDRTAQWPEALEKAFESLETISIDYAVMEKAREVRCVACKFSWSDIGGWMALREYLPQDDAENCYHGEIFTLDSKGNLVYCENTNETVMLVGANDLVIVRSGQKTLIAHKSRTEEMKKLVEAMQGN